MGLMGESNDHRDSVFYGRYSSSTRYSKLDKAVIGLLYSGALRPGDDKKRVAAAVVVR